jgi:hypothetical protein
VLAFAAHGPARADQEQFVVTYVEFLPAKEAPPDDGGLIGFVARRLRHL